ncbi:MAG: glycogen synthase, partial [Flavobacteriaceae bacterium]|nr:glycogen synthase [Flavobacteriaceae bacterium]
MLTVHISAECYPAIKVGGLADVVGSLPKYLIRSGIGAKVVIPFVENTFTQTQELVKEHEAKFPFGSENIPYSIYKINSLDFDLYIVSIPGMFDRPSIYGYEDDNYRFLAFQIAVLQWLDTWSEKIDLIHCHDHHTGLIPFFVKYAFQFRKFAETPTVFTIHNAQYQGWMPWEIVKFFPWFEPQNASLLAWNNVVNSLAVGVKCAWKVTTVSPNYMNQLSFASNGLEFLFQIERAKCTGILNGIDDTVWNPETDTEIVYNYDVNHVEKGKAINKKEICDRFNFDEKKPLVFFIGRIVADKGADLLGTIIWRALQENNSQCNFLVMGSGNTQVADGLELMKMYLNGKFNTFFGYDEKLAHQLYAGADFLLMPSRVEPCGLNQMYSLKYGTMPIVSNVGGLNDTVVDFEEKNGYGIRFLYYSIEDILFSINRAEKIFMDKNA